MNSGKMTEASDRERQAASREMVIREAAKRRISDPAGTRGQEVLNALMEIIEVANLKVGDRLPSEKELASSLGVGRSSIREALTAWQRMGIIVRNKGAGTRLAADVTGNGIQKPVVIQVEAQGLMRTLAVRRPLELEVARLAIHNATEKDMRIINARCEELLALYEAGENWFDADHRFHEAIYDASGNPLFGQLIKQLHAAFHDIYQAPFDQPKMADRSIPIHRDLADAIIARNWEKTKAVLIEIFSIVEDEVTKILHEEQ